jgi:hypothetical protein
MDQERELAVALGALVLVLWTWGYAIFGLFRFVRPALRSGVLEVRGRSYSRSAEPLLFWFGVVFWIVMTVLLAYPAVMVALQFWRQFAA